MGIVEAEMTSDHGLFGPGSVTWRVHADPAYAAATFSGLLLQALHPQAMAAVDQNGGFRDDWWGRLNRTGDYLFTTTFGTEREAVRAGARVRGIHRKLRATDPYTGENFRVDRPDLLLWVHNSVTDTVLQVAGRAGMELTAGDQDRYVREQVRAAELVGLTADLVPDNRADLADYMHDIRPVLALTEPAREGIWVLANPPMASWVKLLTPARAGWAGLAGLAVGLLPGWARQMYGLPGLPLTDVAATAGLRALRGTARVLPDRWRDNPSVRAARARVAA